MLRYLTITAATWLLLTSAVIAQIQFCGETLPQNQPDVQQRWERTLSRQAAQSQQVVRLKQRAAVVFSVIEPILERYAVPKDFKYIPLIESVLHPYPSFYGDAAGFWQLTPQQGRKLGLMVAGRGRDQRYDLRKSTVAVCTYLWQLHRELGSWALVAAAYHGGAQGIKTLKDEQKQASYFSVAYHPETKSALYQALVLKELFTRPATYANRVDEPTRQAISTRRPELTANEQQTIMASVTNQPDVQRPEPTPEPTTKTPIVVLTQESVAPAQFSQTRAATVSKSEIVATVAPSLLVESRSVAGNTLAEGQLVLFEVVRPQLINGISVSVGDVIYAHIETMDAATGRVFLRADRLLSAQTQTTVKLNMIAVEKAKQPGVLVPSRNQIGAGWRLSWESL
jgi:membrane-bound lytic murein transglycosylase D